MRGAVQQHVGEKIGLVNLTSSGTGRSDPNGDFILLKIRKIVFRAIASYRFFREIAGIIGPLRTILDKKNVYLVSFFVGELGELKTSCC
jgi:hypothetical protein